MPDQSIQKEITHNLKHCSASGNFVLQISKAEVESPRLFASRSVLDRFSSGLKNTLCRTALHRSFTLLQTIISSLSPSLNGSATSGLSFRTLSQETENLFAISKTSSPSEANMIIIPGSFTFTGASASDVTIDTSSNETISAATDRNYCICTFLSPPMTAEATHSALIYDDSEGVTTGNET